MSNNQKRFKYSLVKVDSYYRVQCDDNLELVSGKIHGKKKAEKILKDHIGTAQFLEASKDLSEEEIIEIVKLFGGRLRPKQKPWTLQEATLVASIYNSRGELYNENQKCYLSAYQKGWLDQICAHMVPSRKVNKFTYGVLNPNAALAKLFDYETHVEFTRDNQSAYDALRRFGVDTVELFDNRDDAKYLQMVIKKLAAEAVQRFCGQ